MTDQKVEEADGGAMCLPMCSGRVYTSPYTHMGFFLSSVSCVTSGLLSIIYLTSFLDSFLDLDLDLDSCQTDQTFGWASVGISLGSAVSAGLFFCCGTKKKQILNNEETDKLIFEESISRLA